MKPYTKKIIKPWGYEIIITDPKSPYTGKIAYTKAGHRWSLQYHDIKEETICLISGKAQLWLENDKSKINIILMDKNVGYLIKPLQKHRFYALTNCVSIEVSTPEKGKTIRLEDDYQRSDETDENRKLRNNKGVYLG